MVIPTKSQHINFEVNVHLFLVQKMKRVKQIARGGWSGFGMVTVGIDPNTFEVLNGHPTKIPTDRILGGVVQNCQSLLIISALGAENWCAPPMLINVNQS